ncbi:glutamine amidotransferase subunit [Saccharomycopsis crataegensis]|uniref:Glutamine amidotransferase subunit n=1 Tax=Saccharomycopsis crataegensis TaxID=43959 RepID=A0AAV5QT89_9ASCO|nr:glutamine amidotransferase subunit [Saccharomycopsis crataegensis]
MSFDKHLPVVNNSLYSLSNASNSSIASINININNIADDSHNLAASTMYNPIPSTTGPGTAEDISPTLLHHWSHGYSVLSIAVSKKHNILFAGTQDSKLLACDLTNFQTITTIDTEHNGSILNLKISDNEKYLFSTSSDSLIKIWDISKLTATKSGIFKNSYPLIQELTTIYSLLDVGDIFSIALSHKLNVLFFGTQNACIQWVNLSDKKNFIKVSKKTLNKLPFLRYDKFFDSKPGVRGSEKNFSNEINEKVQKYSDKLEKTKSNLSLIETPLNNVIPFAHNGFIYDMKIVPSSLFQGSNFPNHVNIEKFSEYLISTAGDGLVKIWGIYDKVIENGPQLKFLHELDNEDPVLSITINGVFLYCGLTDSKVKVWDLSTLQLIRLIDKDNMGEINSLVYCPTLNCLFKGTETGCCQYSMHISSENYDNNNDVTVDNGAVWKSKEKSILAVDIIFNSNNTDILVTAGQSGISIWNLPTRNNNFFSNTNQVILNDQPNLDMLSNNHMLKHLSTFISFKTISKRPDLYIDDSRNCANFLNCILKSYGASETRLLPVENGNPVVYALFKANGPEVDNYERTPRVLWYGHYDVVETENDKGWDTDPFTLTAQDGYLYSRGVSDNKGPVLSSIFSISELHTTKKLNSDVVFLIEGEEESGSFGFHKTIGQNKELVGDIDWILFSNSYWLDDYTPCLNYGLRGLISCEVEMHSEKPDRHSGVDGGISREPTIDLINLLSTLTDNRDGQVLVPGFYDPILPISEEELKLYRNIIENVVPDTKNHTDLNINNLLRKWRLPSLTIHKLRVSGPKNSTIIPKVASTTLSLRIVPDQNIDTVKSSLVNYLRDNFSKFNTTNILKIKIMKKTEPWLGDLNNDFYKILNDAISEVWNVQPLYIREGGSISSIRFLEKFFNANAAQIPCGQSSDNAHLNDERLRITNLFNLKKILTRVFQQVPLNDHKNQVAFEQENYNNDGAKDTDEFAFEGTAIETKKKQKTYELEEFLNKLVIH